MVGFPDHQGEAILRTVIRGPGPLPFVASLSRRVVVLNQE